MDWSQAQNLVRDVHTIATQLARIADALDTKPVVAEPSPFVEPSVQGHTDSSGITWYPSGHGRTDA